MQTKISLDYQCDIDILSVEFHVTVKVKEIEMVQTSNSDSIPANYINPIH